MSRWMRVAKLSVVWITIGAMLGLLLAFNSLEDLQMQSPHEEVVVAKNIDQWDQTDVNQFILSKIEQGLMHLQRDCLGSTMFQNLNSQKSVLMYSDQPCSSQSEFCALQQQCESFPIVYHFIRSGLGSGLNNLFNLGLYGYLMKRPMLVADEFNYGEFSSYFERIDQCQETPDEQGTWCTGNFTIDSGQNSSIFCDIWRVSMIRNVLKENNAFSLGLKRRYADSTLRLNTSIKPLVESLVEFAFLKELATSKDCSAKQSSIGVHIRRGDKKTEAKLLPIEEYVRKVLELINASGKSAQEFVVFVASDSRDALEEFKHHPSLSGVAITSLPQFEYPKSLSMTVAEEASGHNETNFNSQPSLCKYKATIELLAELEALARTDYLICTYSSNLCRLLQVLRRHDPSSVHSLDIPNWDFEI
jgi:hypothetical protein